MGGEAGANRRIAACHVLNVGGGGENTQTFQKVYYYKIKSVDATSRPALALLLLFVKVCLRARSEKQDSTCTYCRFVTN